MMNHPTVLSLSRYEFAAQSAQELKPALPSPVVYDVGAGQGQMRTPIQALELDWQGFDAFPASDSVKRWDLDDPCPAKNPEAGLVLLLEVIEHLRNPGISLRHVAAALLPGGRLLVTTPNPRWSRSRLTALRTGFLSCFTQNDLDLNGHVFPVWPHVLERMMQEAGLTIEKYATLDGRTVWPGGPISVRYPVRLAHAALNKWIERRDTTACGMSYAVIARKAE